MTRTIFVTRAQVRAAQFLIERSAITGRPLSPAILKIANAKSANGRSTPSQSDDTSAK